MKAPFIPTEANITNEIKINVDEIPDVDRKKIAEAGSAMLARFFADPVISQKIDDRIAKKATQSQEKSSKN